jgi:DNA-binding response OmpR family regulator
MLLWFAEVAIMITVQSTAPSNRLPAYAVGGRHESGRYFAGGIPSPGIFELHISQCDGPVPLREIRSSCDKPIIITSGGQCDENDRIAALEVGAEHVSKPFSRRESLSRARAVLRRPMHGQATRDPKRGGFSFGGWGFERRARRLLGLKGNPVSLTKREFVLLVAASMPE